MYDSYGRTSFYFVTFGSWDVPIFQPGTIMFLSAVKSSSSRARFDKDSHQMNDLILGPRDAIYLATFITGLHRSYTREISNVTDIDSTVFQRAIFEKVLKDKLEEYSQEDQDNFCR